MSGEPTASPAPSAPTFAPVETLSPEQATATIAAWRAADASHPWKDAGHPRTREAHDYFLALAQRVHGTGKAELLGGRGETVPAPAVGAVAPATRYEEPPVQVLVKADDAPSAPQPSPFDDVRRAAPRTAAQLDAVPPPQFSPEAVKAGFQWDETKLRAINAVAEREGVTALVLEGRHVVAGALSGPPVDAVTAERQLHERWGRAFPSKLEAAHVAFDALPAEVRADLERRELDVHPTVMDFLARVGEQMMDPTTPGGFARLKARGLEGLKAAESQGGGR